MAWFFRGFQPQGLNLDEFLREEWFTAFQFRNQAFIQNEEFTQPPSVTSDQVAVLQIEAFEEQVAHLSKAGCLART